MKRFFTLLLILCLYTFIHAQEKTPSWKMEDAFLHGDSITIVKIFYKKMETQEIEHGYARSMTFQRFQQKIRIGNNCEITLPEDEYILKLTDKFVYTGKFIFEKPYRKRLTHYLIKNCELQKTVEHISPLESEFFIADAGHVLITDFYEGYGKRIFVMDSTLKEQTIFEPFKEGFNNILVEDIGNNWQIILSKKGPIDRSFLFTLKKDSLSISSPIPLAINPEGWHSFTPLPEGFLLYQFGQLMLYDHEGNVLWERDEAIYNLSIGNQHFVIAKNDSISCIHTLSGNQKWAIPLTRLCKEDSGESGLLNPKVVIKEIQQNDKGILVLTAKDESGWTVPTIKSTPRLIFIKHDGKVLFNKKVGAQCQFIKAFFQGDSIILLIDENTHILPIPE